MNRVTQKDVIDWLENLYDNSAVYVWGANGDVITKPFMDELYNLYGDDTYNKNYYNAKLVEGKGKICADGPGVLFKLSNEDRTVRKYYNTCIIKGRVASLPKDKVCLVFNKNFTHLGIYMGNGITIEMRNSKVNMIKENFKISRWCYFGIPDFIDYGVTFEKLNEEVLSCDTIISSYQVWINKLLNGPLVKVDGVYGSNTKSHTICLIKHILNHYYGKSLEEDDVFDLKTKTSFPSFDVLKSNEEAFQMLTYIVHIYLYAKCGYFMNNIINGSKISTVYDDNTKQYVALYQSEVRGLDINGLISGSTLYQMFK